MSSVAAKVMKSKNECRVAAGTCVSTCDVSAGWLMVGTVAVSPKLVAFAGFNWCFEDFLAIVCARLLVILRCPKLS